MFTMRMIVQAGSLLLLSAGAISPAQAVITTFAQYSQPTPGTTLRWLRSGANAQFFTIATPSSNVPGTAHVNFSFLQPYLAGLGALPANMKLNASVTATPATPVFGSLAQGNITGTFSFLYSGTTPLTVGQTSYAPGSNLLSGSFSKGVTIGGVGASTGYFSASTGSGSTVSFTSDFLDFSAATQRDMTLALASIAPTLFAVTGAPLRDFRAVGIGIFSSDSAYITAAIPEPASWAMMFTGFALLGGALRRRRRAMVVA